MPFLALWGRFDRILMVRKQRYSLHDFEKRMIIYYKLLGGGGVTAAQLAPPPLPVATSMNM
jgi:hypothetical protein